MRRRPAYYTVFALRDRTVVAALQTRKPLAPRRGRRPKIDPEGVHTWHEEDANDFGRLPDVRAAALQSTIAACLNVRRIVRERVEARLDELDCRLAAMQAQLDRIEHALISRASKPGQRRTSAAPLPE